MKTVYFNEIYVACYITIFCMISLLQKIKFHLSFMKNKTYIGLIHMNYICLTIFDVDLQ